MEPSRSCGTLRPAEPIPAWGDTLPAEPDLPRRVSAAFGAAIALGTETVTVLLYTVLPVTVLYCLLSYLFSLITCYPVFSTNDNRLGVQNVKRLRVDSPIFADSERVAFRISGLRGHVLGCCMGLIGPG